MPNYQAKEILVQLKSCKSLSSKIQNYDYNAFINEQLKDYKIYYADTYGIKYRSNNAYLENELQLSGES